VTICTVIIDIYIRVIDIRTRINAKCTRAIVNHMRVINDCACVIEICA